MPQNGETEVRDLSLTHLWMLKHAEASKRMQVNLTTTKVKESTEETHP